MFKMNVLLIIFVFVVQVQNKLLPPSQQYTYEPGCVVHSIGRVLSYNETYSPRDGINCELYKCDFDGYTYIKSCVIPIEGNCFITPGNKSLAYPDCCDNFDCSTRKKNTSNIKSPTVKPHTNANTTENQTTNLENSENRISAPDLETFDKSESLQDLQTQTANETHSNEPNKNGPQINFEAQVESSKNETIENSSLNQQDQTLDGSTSEKPVKNETQILNSEDHADDEYTKMETIENFTSSPQTLTSYEGPFETLNENSSQTEIIQTDQFKSKELFENSPLDSEETNKDNNNRDEEITDDSSLPTLAKDKSDEISSDSKESDELEPVKYKKRRVKISRKERKLKNI